MLGDLEGKLLGKSANELNAAERRVLKRARERRTLSTNASEDFQAAATPSQRLADAIARVGGSWTFIIAFLVFLVAWVILNTVILASGALDPYPFIFLNLLLSMLAAIQAPVIMMSQNRQAARDRYMAAKDYEINLKAEIEVLALHHKIDMQVLTELQATRADIAALRQVVETLSSSGRSL
ncbi:MULTISPECIES: DUF1003 domain-containing protein [Alphaproteobacteria]|uniref:Cyclic nucleotide-binding protein n=2 Tax=Alphaproteobacteria TaxID=28211 RepID=A0A512HD18_9HYPH|nr:MULTISPECIES: DUF1003 domain-containing protein [Alphaproteobacteria]GEO83260.1 hypothetical protein RNA01_01920 [Ciceribacter naphthalenivorans]GLR20345.1 hypothetical protein GCM10007920_01290 [Ciceribacter naphthalenivorans]GLT03201.1 hypothetical protein GCM10007926_01290 [Sphingomonas psychrolutea]